MAEFCEEGSDQEAAQALLGGPSEKVDMWKMCLLQPGMEFKGLLSQGMQQWELGSSIPSPAACWKKMECCLCSQHS